MGYKQSADGSQIFAQQQLLLGQERFLRVDNGTALMNIDGGPTGTPVIVWDGEGSYWTPIGTGSSSSGAAHAGTSGWDTGVTALNDTTRFDGGADQDIDGTYTQLDFWMQPKAFPTGSRLAVFWRNAANDQIGNILKVNDYVTDFDLDAWQKVSIPVADFNLAANADKLVFRYAGQAGQDFWFDDLKLLPPGGGPYIFRAAAPDDSVRWHVSMLVMILSAGDTGWNSDVFCDLASGLEKGLVLRQRKLSTSEVLWALNSKDNTDLFGRFHPQESFAFGNNQLLLGFMMKPGKASVIVTDDEVLEFLVRDDLSGLVSARAFVHFGQEVIDA